MKAQAMISGRALGCRFGAEEAEEHEDERSGKGAEGVEAEPKESLLKLNLLVNKSEDTHHRSRLIQ